MSSSLPTATAPTETIYSGNDTKIYLKAETSPTESEQVPTVGEINYSPAGSVEQIPLQGDSGSDRAVKNGINGTITFVTKAPKSNSVVAEILAAADAVGPAANMLCILELPDGRYYAGQVVVNQAVPQTPTRGSFGYSVTVTTDGPFTAS